MAARLVASFALSAIASSASGASNVHRDQNVPDECFAIVHAKVGDDKMHEIQEGCVALNPNMAGPCDYSAWQDAADDIARQQYVACSQQQQEAPAMDTHDPCVDVLEAGVTPEVVKKIADGCSAEADKENCQFLALVKVVPHSTMADYAKCQAKDGQPQGASDCLGELSRSLGDKQVAEIRAACAAPELRKCETSGWMRALDKETKNKFNACQKKEADPGDVYDEVQKWMPLPPTATVPVPATSRWSLVGAAAGAAVGGVAAMFALLAWRAFVAVAPAPLRDDRGMVACHQVPLVTANARDPADANAWAK